MKRNGPLMLLVVTLALSLKAQADAIVFSNLQGNALLCECSLNQGRSLGTLPSDPLENFTRADAFTTPSTTDFTLDRIELAVGLISGDANSLNVRLYRDQNGSLGALQESFQVNNQMAPFGKDHVPMLVDSVLHPTLTASTDYWLLATTIDPGTGAGWYTNNAEDIGPVGTGITGANNAPFCCVRDDLRDTFAIFGTPIQTPPQAIPEPSTGWMLGVWLSVLLLTPRYRQELKRDRPR